MKSSYQYRKRDYGFGNLCLTLRTAIGVTQGELAHLLGVTERTIQTWEGGSSYPKIDRLKHFIELCVQHQAFAAGHEEEEIRALWQAARQRVLLDESWLTRLLGASLPDVISVPTGQPTATDAASLPTALPTSQVGALPRIDWVGALDVGSFRGREVELADLSRWILQEQCRFVAILGMGGIGKSALVSLLGHQLARHFEIVLWRSVRDAPSCEELVADCITFFSETPPAEFPCIGYLDHPFEKEDPWAFTARIFLVVKWGLAIEIAGEEFSYTRETRHVWAADHQDRPAKVAGVACHRPLQP